jgi:hypothetical protein
MADAEVESILRVVLGNADFPDMNFTDAINTAIDVCYRAAAVMDANGDRRLSERTRAAIKIRAAFWKTSAP